MGMIGRQYASDMLVIPDKAKTRLVIPSAGDALRIGAYSISNKSGGAADCGIGYQHLNAWWKAGQWINAAGTPYTDDTTDAQSAAASDFALATATVNNDGFLIQSLFPFNVVGLTIGTAATGGTAEYAYWSGAAFTVFTPISVPTFTSTGEQVLVFGTLADWAKGAGSGTDANRYSLRVRFTTAPNPAAVATIAWVANLKEFTLQVANNAKAEGQLDQTEILLPPNASIIAYVGTTNTANTLEIAYRAANIQAPT